MSKDALITDAMLNAYLESIGRLIVIDPGSKVPRTTTDMGEYAAYRDSGRWRVAESNVGDVWISTVVLSITHPLGLGTDGAAYFETMIFGGKAGDYQVRASTWEEAERNHEEALSVAMTAHPELAD